MFWFITHFVRIKEYYILLLIHVKFLNITENNVLNKFPVNPVIGMNKSAWFEIHCMMQNKSQKFPRLKLIAVGCIFAIRKKDSNFSTMCFAVVLELFLMQRLIPRRILHVCNVFLVLVWCIPRRCIMSLTWYRTVYICRYFVFTFQLSAIHDCKLFVKMFTLHFYIMRVIFVVLLLIKINIKCFFFYTFINMWCLSWGNTISAINYEWLMRISNVVYYTIFKVGLF